MDLLSMSCRKAYLGVEVEGHSVANLSGEGLWGELESTIAN
jgi:hypothetical protein